MKQFVKDWLLPPKINEKISSFKTSLDAKKQKGFESIQNNAKLKNLHEGETCFILGNGPSINDIPNFEALANETVFSISSLFLHDKYKVMKPKYHVTTFIKNLTDDKKKWLEDMGEALTTQKVFFHIQQYEFIANSEYFKEYEKYFLSTANIQRTFDISKITRGYRTNPIMALEIAIYMGFKKIYLVGIEHNSFVDMNYFYAFGREKFNVKDGNIKEGNIMSHTMIESFYKHYLTYLEFQNIADYAKENQIEIINLSSISRLDMFEKQEIGEAII